MVKFIWICLDPVPRHIVVYKARKSFLSSHRMWLDLEQSTQTEPKSRTKEVRQEYNYGFCLKQQSWAALVIWTSPFVPPMRHATQILQVRWRPTSSFLCFASHLKVWAETTEVWSWQGEWEFEKGLGKPSRMCDLRKRWCFVFYCDATSDSSQNSFPHQKSFFLSMEIKN